MATTKEKRNRIDAMASEETGETCPAHCIGTTRGGHKLYQFSPGWWPVAELSDGLFVPSSGLRRNRDGNYVVPRS